MLLLVPILSWKGAAGAVEWFVLTGCLFSALSAAFYWDVAGACSERRAAQQGVLNHSLLAPSAWLRSSAFLIFPPLRGICKVLPETCSHFDFEACGVSLKDVSAYKKNFTVHPDVAVCSVSLCSGLLYSVLMVRSLLLVVSDKTRLVKHNSTSGRSVFQTWCSKVFDVAVTQKENVSLCLLTYLDSCSVKTVNGMLYNPLTGSWSWIESTSINYALHAVKSGDQAQTSQTEPLSEMESEQCSATAGTSVWPAEMCADGLPPGAENVLHRLAQ